jgi:hypothetical protein
MFGAVSTARSIFFNLVNTGGVYQASSANGLITLGEKQFFAVTRTNNGTLSKYELYLSPDATSDAVLVGTSLTFNETYAHFGAGDLGQIAGYGGGSTCQLDDFQWTANVNRYRGLTSFPVPTGPLPTS